MTNGEKLQSIFPTMRINVMKSYVQVMGVNYEFNNLYPLDWWNAEYKEPTTKNNLAVDCISRQAVLNKILKFSVTDGRSVSVTGLWTEVNGLPSVTPIRTKGHWIEHEKSISTAFKHLRECSCCKCYFDWLMPRNSFCPNCGADMREVEK